MAGLVESTRLEIEYTVNKRYRGFKSHSLRYKDTEVVWTGKLTCVKYAAGAYFTGFEINTLMHQNAS